MREWDEGSGPLSAGPSPDMKPQWPLRMPIWQTSQGVVRDRSPAHLLCPIAHTEGRHTEGSPSANP